MRILITGGSGFIGTNLITSLIEKGAEILNVDVEAPMNPVQSDYWIKCSIMDSVKFTNQVQGFKPEYVIHLAARTDCDENTTVEDDYQLNVEGTQNVLEAVKGCSSIKRVIITSSQYVCGPGRLPEHDEDFFPHTVYGQSKVLTEKLTREADLKCVWMITRPVNIWGPYHKRYKSEFWKIVNKGLYFHPNIKSPTRTYGYVENIVWQMERMLELEAAKVNKQVFYLGDKPIVIEKWVMAFCLALRGKRPIRIPRFLITIMAKTGDVISKFKKKPFYITSSRLNSMSKDYYAPMDKSFEVLGEPSFSLEEGVEKSVIWFKNEQK